MKTRMNRYIAVLVICTSIISNAAVADKPSRAVLEKSWQTYLEASKSGKESELEKSMSAFRLGEMRNNLAAAKRSLTPEMIKSIAEYGPDISTAQFVTLLEKGPTAGLVYVQDAEKEADGKPRITFTFIKFVFEEARWKVDGAMNIGSPKFLANGKKSEFDLSELPEGYEIDGVVRQAPHPASTPQVSAMLDVYCPGYKIQLTINGAEQQAVVDKSSSGLLKEGLRKGKNTILIVVSKIDKEAVFTPRVTLRQILDNRNIKDLFKFEPKEKIEGRHTFTFTAD